MTKTMPLPEFVYVSWERAVEMRASAKRLKLDETHRCLKESMYTAAYADVTCRGIRVPKRLVDVVETAERLEKETE